MQSDWNPEQGVPGQYCPGEVHSDSAQLMLTVDYVLVHLALEHFAIAYMKSGLLPIFKQASCLLLQNN